MKQIPLTQGLFALVDEEDYEELSKFKWHTMRCGRRQDKYYAARRCRITKQIVRMHREVMGLGQWRDEMDKVVDHVVGTCAAGHEHDGSGLDNRKCGLEIVTPEENLRRIKNWKKKIEEPWF